MEEYTLDEILDELKSRYPLGFCMAGARLSKDGDYTEGTDYMTRSRGVPFTCLGLIDALRDEIRKDLMDCPITSQEGDMEP